MARYIRRIIHIKGTETVIGLTSPQEPISKPVVHFTAKQVCTTKAFKTERLSVQLKPITFPTKMYSVMLDHKYLIMLYKQYLEGLFPQRKKYQPRADRSKYGIERVTSFREASVISGYWTNVLLHRLMEGVDNINPSG